MTPQNAIYVLSRKVTPCRCHRGLAKGGARGPEPPEFGRSVNPIQTSGADYALHTTASPSGFKKISTPLCHVPKAITALKHLRKPSAAFQEANLHRKNFFFSIQIPFFRTLKTHDAKMKSSLN